MAEYITADKRKIFDCPKLPPATSFTYKTLYETENYRETVFYISLKLMGKFFPTQNLLEEKRL
jgi:hypothetical protein